VHLLDSLDESSKTENSGLNKFVKRNIHPIIFLLLLTSIVTVITYYRILVQMDIGPISDSFDFLSNALVYAGQGMGYADLLRPPFFSFLISLVFRLGYVSTSVVFYMDGLLFIFGVIGLFLLLKIRFNDLESFLGGLLYATFPIVLTIVGVGFSDLASVSFTIWAFYFLVLAVKKDSRFFYLSFPFLMFAFLTRYNNALLIFPIFLYLVINKDRINLKQVSIGVTASILVIVPVLIFFYEKFDNMIYPFINFGSSSTATALTSSPENFAYNPNIFFFIQNLPDLIGVQGIFIILIVIFGLILYSIFKIIGEETLNQNYFDKLNLKEIKTQIIWIVLIGIVIIFLGSFGKTFYIVNEILFFFIAFIFYELTKNLKIKHMNLHLMFFTWFMAFFIFNSIYVIKDLRYFVLMAPPVAYFLILGLSEISKQINVIFRIRNIVFSVLAIILISIILLTTASQIPLILESNTDKVTANQQIKESSLWFEGYNPNYKNQNLYSDLSPNFSWYLKTNVKMVPVFKDNKTFPNGVKNYTLNQADSNAFNKYLKNNNADYYFSVREGLNLTSYKPIKQFGIVIIYKKIN
jgi:4-amino-4-deoxy-L-arabinose transferase-like glycosyltransferase